MINKLIIYSGISLGGVNLEKNKINF